MTTTNKNAPAAGGHQREGENQPQILMKGTSVTIVSETYPDVERPRYVVVGTDIYDRESDRIAKFENAGVAQLGADWLNSPDATPEDYQWTTAEEMTSDEWLAVHPEVAEAAPAWATETTASDDAPRVAISYDRTSGAVEIGSAASWLDGDMIQADPGVYVYFTANESRVTADDLRRFAADFSALADALEVSA